MDGAPLLMGIDLGTSSTKTAIVDLEGRLLAVAQQEYPISSPHPGWAEQDPRVWYHACLVTTRSALAQLDRLPGSIAAISLSGQMHTTVCLDAAGIPLRPAILWADQRSGEQVDQVYARIGRENLAAWTANPLAAGFMLATWLWLLENEPELCRKTRHLLLPKDYLRYRLTGNFGSEASDAASTLLFDPAQRDWSEPLLSALSIDRSLFPRIYPSSAIAGELLADAAQSMGLRPGIPVIFGGSDQALQALAHGVIRPGLVSCTIGTGGQLFTSCLTPRPDPGLRLHLFCHVLPNLWHLEAAILSAGLSLRWLRDSVFKGMDYTSLADLASQAPPGSEGLFFLPYLAGERTPLMDPEARASFIGLTVRHGQSHIIRAVMEGVVFALRQGLVLMEGLGVPVERVLASGGATRHPLWLQLQADIFNRPVYPGGVQEASARGAAMLAGIGVGLFQDGQDACDRTVHLPKTAVMPQSDWVAQYQSAFRLYTQLYPAVDPRQR